MTACTHIQLTGAGQRYGYRWILRGVDLRLSMQDVTLFYGANGSGKTTLLKTILGIRPAAEGSVDYLNTPAAGSGPAGDATGSPPTVDRKTFIRYSVYIGHDGGSYLDMTATENLDFWCRIYSQAAVDRRRRIDRALERAGLQSKLQVRFFSRGMRQRLNLARIFLFDEESPPAWIFLDEPLTGLDAAGRTLLTGLLAERKAAGLGAVVVTHEPDFFQEVETARIIFENKSCQSVTADGQTGLSPHSEGPEKRP